ncbi:MAG: VIT1/CCC1 transporter family protein [Methanomicrobia archaeon]|nr:VIT1/CCC1 transporter family protein [Methanomicrobia archaeon]
MRHSLKTGFCFGLTSGIITTLGLMVGLNSSTHSKSIVVGGILVIAIADALSDAMGIHMSEESENKHTPKEIWESTLATFLSKFVFALTFIVPILLFQLSTAIIVSIIWGLSLLGIFSFYIAREQKTNPLKVVAEHLILASIVIIITHYVGDWVSSVFG